jgi:hypothetical protein
MPAPSSAHVEFAEMELRDGALLMILDRITRDRFLPHAHDRSL